MSDLEKYSKALEGHSRKMVKLTKLGKDKEKSSFTSFLFAWKYKSKSEAEFVGIEPLGVNEYNFMMLYNRHQYLGGFGAA